MEAVRLALFRFSFFSAIITSMEYKGVTKKVALLIFACWLVVFDVRSYHEMALASTDAGDLQDSIEKAQDKKEKVEQALNTSQQLLTKKKAEINVTKTLLQTTAEEISRKEADIDDLNRQIALNQEMLRTYLQEAYYSDQEPLVNIFLAGSAAVGMSNGFDQSMNLNDKIVNSLEEIKAEKDDLAKAKDELDSKKEDHEKLISLQQGQQYEIQSDINEAQATLAELNAKIDKLKNELSSLLSSSVSFKNVVDAAGFAAKVTGIRKDYLLGVLVVESNLGRYTGGCTADKSRMSGYRLETFKNICEELDYNWKKRKVSCPPSGYKGTGGAMGVAQFMSDTWMSYKSSIASVTGHNPPDPWNLTDGVVAMALKLTKVDGVKDHKKSAEAKAYCVYLAGGNWQSYCDNKGVNYGAKVLYWADNYERVME